MFILLFTALLIFGLSLDAHGSDKKTSLLLDAGDDTSHWQNLNGPFASADIAAVPIKGKDSEKCIRLEWAPAAAAKAWVTFSPGIDFGDYAAISFLLRAGGDGKETWKLMIESDSEDGTFAIAQEISLDFNGWVRVRLSKQDFVFSRKRSMKELDWSQIKTFKFGLKKGTEKPAILIDDIRYEDPVQDKATQVPDEIMLHNCDTVAGWNTDGGITLDVSNRIKMEGDGCLLVRYGKKKRQSLRLELDKSKTPTDQHAFSMWYRGPGIDTKAKLELALVTASGAKFVRDLHIVNNEWGQLLLFPQDFRTQPDNKGRAPQWRDINRVVFTIRVPAPGIDETLQLDEIKFMRIATPRSAVKAHDKNFWWWSGPVDRFAAMHLRFAEWPRIAGMGEHELASFSEYLLPPGMPYNLFLRNNESYARFKITIRNWDGKTVKVINTAFDADNDDRYPQRIAVALTAPQKCGTYVFDIECYSKDGQVVRRYQTGIFVLAKILSEPYGYWGLHTYIGTKGKNAPHFSWIINTLDAFGVKIIRERIPFPVEGVAGNIFTDRVRELAELAHQHNIRVVGLLRARKNSTAYQMRGGAKPEKVSNEELVLKQTSELAASYKGLIDIWEVFNEPNRGRIDGYAEVLRLTYMGLKKGDPQCTVSMAGMGVWNNWQTQLIDLEKKTGRPYSDMLAAHLYPEPENLENMLREMVHSQDKYLAEKGMLMSEGGKPELDYKEQSLVRAGLLSADYRAERMTQNWYARYGPVILGECLNMGAKLYGCLFFRCVPSMGDWFLKDGDIRIHGNGFFTNRWNTRTITLARPAAYTLNTLARLLTHEVKPAKVKIDYNKNSGRVEHYAFQRPGETILALWIGVHAGMRAEEIDVKVPLPQNIGLVLVADNDGNEQALEHAGGVASLRLVRENVSFVRMLEGAYDRNVFLQHIDQLPRAGWPHRYQLVTDRRPALTRKAQYTRLMKAGVPAANTPARDRINIYLGTSTDNPGLIEGVARDRDLPVISESAPREGRPFVLYSATQRKLYIIGQSDEDINKAIDSFLRQIEN